MTLPLTPSVQSPRAYDAINLTANKIAARLASGVNAAQRLNLRAALQDAGYRYKITPEETAAGLTEADLTFGFDPGDVRRYGAVGDGVTDDHTALAAALSVQQNVFVPPGFNCKSSQSLQMLSNQTLWGIERTATIKCSAAATNTLEMNGLQRACVVGVCVIYAGTSTTGAQGSAVFIHANASKCTVRACRLEGVLAGVTMTYADDSTIDDNEISSITQAIADGPSWDISVYLGGSRNRITRNKCYGGGSCGIQLLSDNSHGVDDNIVMGNEITQHTQYGVLAYANLPGGSAENNLIAGNQIRDILGTFYTTPGALVFGAGIYVASAEGTAVSNNIVKNTNVSTNTQTLAPGAIGVLGTSRFSVTGNIVVDPVWYGIYATTDGDGSGSGLITDNVISGPTLDGIYAHDMNDVSIHDNAINGGAQHGISYTHASLGTGISIQANKVKGCASGTGIRVTNTQCPNIAGNYVRGCLNGATCASIIGGFIERNELRNNSSNDFSIDNTSSGFIFFDKNTVRSSATNGVNDSAGMVYGHNDVSGQTNPYAGITIERALDNSATPSVLGSRMGVVNTGTSITDLLNPYAGQVVHVRAANARTLKHNTGSAATKLILQGAADFVMAANNSVTLEYAPGGPWYERGRKT